MRDSGRQDNRPVAIVERAVRDAIRAAGLADGARLVVAVSGGPDSLALLSALSRLSESMGLYLHGAHLDHGLRGAASTADASFVQDTFARLQVPSTVRQADVDALRRARKLSPEDAARETRYAFLADVASAQGADAVALGHTADDQAETVLMHILRGSGLRGLRGMLPITSRMICDTPITLVRPVLGLSRAQTVAYCEALGLNPRQDESNLSRVPTRNRVRLDLVPELETFNPAVREALVRLSKAAAIDVDFIDGQVNAIWSRVAVDEEAGVTLRRQALGKLESALQSHVLQRAMLNVKGDLADIGGVHVDDMLRLMDGPAGKTLDLPGGVRFAVSYDTASLRLRGEVTEAAPGRLEGEHRLVIPGETWLPGWLVSSSVDDAPQSGESVNDASQDRFAAIFDFGSLDGGLSVRARAPGDRFQPLGMARGKKLQDFMVDAKIPRGQRDRIPLLVSSRGVAWVVGYRIAEWAKITDERSPRLALRFSPTVQE